MKKIFVLLCLFITLLVRPQTRITSPQSSHDPYLIPAAPGSTLISLFTVGDSVNQYRMAGIPDGMGIIGNSDNTFLLFMNHELGAGAGIPRAHGAAGAFVSTYTLSKNPLTILRGEDLIKNVYLWNGSGYTLHNAQTSSGAILQRFCAADLPPVSSHFNSKTNKGTKDRLFFNGEEYSQGRGFVHVLTGAEKGNSYELPRVGKFSYENLVACHFESDHTVLIGTNDANPGFIYVYVGSKTDQGSVADRAGLTNGKIYVLAVQNYPAETNNTPPGDETPFVLKEIGDVTSFSASQLSAISHSLSGTTFFRPEDGCWDPNQQDNFYFTTTNSFAANSRLYKIHFYDIDSVLNGGTISAVLKGHEGQKMLDNLVITATGHAILQEDPGNTAYLARIWKYKLPSGPLTLLAQHDSTRFLNGSPFFLTQDEESSGIVEASGVLEPGWFLLNVQAHYVLPGELVQGGQLLALFDPELSTGKAEPFSNTNYSVYPNPANNYLTISLPESLSRSLLMINDISGRTVFQLKLAAESIAAHIDITGLKEGIYLLNLRNDNLTFTKKLIVLR